MHIFAAMRKMKRGPPDLKAGGSEWPGPKMNARAMIKSDVQINTRQPILSKRFEALFYISETLKAIN